jgi:hypothetical protein
MATGFRMSTRAAYMVTAEIHGEMRGYRARIFASLYPPVYYSGVS